MKLDEAINRYIYFLQVEKGLSDNTIRSYKDDFKNFLICFPDINDTSMLSEDLFSEFMFFLSIKEIKNTSIRREILTIKNFYLFLEREGIENKLVNKKVETPKCPQPLRTYLTQNEIRTFMKAIDVSTEEGIEEKVISNLLYYCGLRVSELTDLKLKNINEQDKVLKVLGKGNKERYLPFKEEVLVSIKAYMEKVRCNRDFKSNVKNFLLNKHGNPISRQYIYEVIKRITLRAGINKQVHPHTLRHSFATHLIENGANLRVVQDMLGHEKATTTQIYTHITEDQLLEAYDLFWKD